MPGSDDSRSDCALLNTLSARSYLEPTQPEIMPLQSNDSPARVAIELQGNSGPRLRSHVKQPLLKEAKQAEKPKATPEIRDPPVERPIRKRGRPRLETTKDAAAIEGRRLQIRRAQRTYRQKKEATIQSLKTRVGALEQALQNISNILGTDQDEDHAVNTIGPKPDGLARARQLVLAEIDKTRSEHGQQIDHSSGDSIFGYQVSHDRRHIEDEYNKTSSQYRTHPRPRSPSPLLNRLFPSTTIYTYSYQESDFSRRLHRFCLEHTYRWLADPDFDPNHMSRVFGLLPCIQDMPGIRRSFRRTLQVEIGGSLEVVKVPFYKLGGAGTHYPRIGADGRPVYPDNLRRPGKILRRMARILRRGGIHDWDEDWSGDAEPDLQDGIGREERAMSDEERLRSLDLEGEWFDSHDVQGYLEHYGIVSDASSLWLKVPATAVSVLYGFSPDGSTSQYCVSPEEPSPIDMSRTEYSSQSDYVLDVECFFDLLLANLRMLGRAPGFRLWDVDAALRTAIHRRSFT